MRISVSQCGQNCMFIGFSPHKGLIRELELVLHFIDRKTKALDRSGWQPLY